MVLSTLIKNNASRGSLCNKGIGRKKILGLQLAQYMMGLKQEIAETSS